LTIAEASFEYASGRHRVTAEPDRELPKQASVLVLEDDPDFRRVLVEFLVDEGFDVSICDSYSALREAVRSPGPTIVLADFWGTSHARLSQRERDEILELGRDVPTILLTGRAWAVHASAAELKLVCILPKPARLEDISAQVLSCVSRVLDGE
jgi:DNA-binding NtrC family response regulator